MPSSGLGLVAARGRERPGLVRSQPGHRLGDPAVPHLPLLGVVHLAVVLLRGLRVVVPRPGEDVRHHRLLVRASLLLVRHPAGVRRLLVGVYQAGLCRPVAEVLSRLGAEHVRVVNSNAGLDEISASSFTHIAEARDGEISEYGIKPEDWGLESVPLAGLEVEGADQSLALIRDALSGVEGDRAERARSVIAMNAGAALYIAGLADSPEQGVNQAIRLMSNGDAWNKVQELAAFSSQF